MGSTPAYLPPAETARRYSMSRSYLDIRVRDGTWPRPVKIGNLVRHKVALCDAYVEGRVDVDGRPMKQGAAS